MRYKIKKIYRPKPGDVKKKSPQKPAHPRARQNFHVRSRPRGKFTPEILFEDNHLLVAIKPVNMPVQKDESRDLDFISAMRDFIRIRDKKPGNAYLGLVNRLDRRVGGVMVLGKTSKASARISEQIKNHDMEKVYLAVAHGHFAEKTGTLINYLSKDSDKNEVKVVDEGVEGGKYAELSYEVVSEKKNPDLTLLRVHLKTGRGHQIRVQFANIKHPLRGDNKYAKLYTGTTSDEMLRMGILQAHKEQKKSDKTFQRKFPEDIHIKDSGIGLFAQSISFAHPISKEILTFAVTLQKTRLW